MSELLPCPFCGGEAYTLNQAPRGTGYSVGCHDDECRGFIALSWIYKTEAEAIAAWNTRYHSVFEETVIKAWKEIKDYQERTCKVEYQTGSDNPMRGWWLCDQCGGLSDSVGGGWDGSKQKVRPPAYCARCGAKVVDE